MAIIPSLGFRKIISSEDFKSIKLIQDTESKIAESLKKAENLKKDVNLLDEKSEEDNGYVSLVNVNINNGVFEENENYTGTWAWKHPHKDGSTTYAKVTGEVHFDNVDFGYNEEKMVLHNITLTAEPGYKIAFVGSTGAGKTTITNLINRFYDIADGKIRYDGININKSIF